MRLLRDKGFPFEWYDKYATNLFAKHFEKTRDHYDVVTAFELFEHFAEPAEEIERLMALGDNLLFSTELVPMQPPHIMDWWYYAPEHGQHVAFYTAQALATVAERYHRHYTGCRGIHLITRERVPQWKLRLCLSRVRPFLRYVHRRQGLLAQDYEKITGKKLS